MPFCPACGAKSADGTKFCPECGAQQPAPATPAPAQATAPVAPLPGAEPSTSRRVVTAVFTDLSGSTAMGERLDPENVRQVMSRYFSKMSEVLTAHGGTVEKFIGDAVVAVFGIPSVHEDDALRAVRAALQMRAAIDEFNEELSSRWGVELQARIGVNTGEVIAGDATSGQGFSTGDTMNVAARLEQMAAPGEILLGAPTYRLTSHAIEAEELEGLELKGKAAPVAAWRLLSVSAHAEAISRRLDSPMIGRAEELAALREIFDSVTSTDTCRLVTVFGPAGIGKSRLVAELLNELSSGARVVRGRCLPYGEGITFWALGEVVTQLADLVDSDSPAEREAKVAAQVSDKEEAGLIAAHLAEAMGYREASVTSQEIFWAARRLFEHAAAQGPLVVVFDDTHWAEPTFLDLIEYIATWSSHSPILLICPSRPELLDERPDWSRGNTAAHTLTLKPLSDEEMHQLIDALLGKSALPEPTIARVVELAGGNPLFVEELVRMLADEGLLKPNVDGWSVSEGTVTVPPSIQALIAARLDRLNPSERSTLQRGAVIGKMFWWGAVAEMSPSAERSGLATNLQMLVRREILEPDRSLFLGEDAFRFSHILTRDASYEALPKSARADLHERFGGWLENKLGDRSAEFEEILGYHLEQAVTYRRSLGSAPSDISALSQRSASWLLAGGRRALTRGDMPAATNLLSRAADLLEPDSPGRPEVLLSMCDALIETGDLQAAEAAAREVQTTAQASSDEHLAARAEVFLLMLQVYKGECDEVPDQARATIDVLEGRGDHLGLAQAHQVIAELLWDQSEYVEAQSSLELALDHARRAGSGRDEAKILSWLPFVLIWGPAHRAEAIARCESIMEEGLGHRAVQAKCGSVLAALYAMEGRFDVARDLGATSNRTLDELGMKVAMATGTQLTGLIEVLAGDLAAAEAEYRRGLEALKEIGDVGYQLGSAGFLARSLVEQDRLDEAEELITWIRANAPEDDRTARADWEVPQSRILARRGDCVTAEKLARDATSVFEEVGEVINHADSLVALAEVLAACGRRAEALAAAIEAKTLYEQKGVEPMIEKLHHTALSYEHD